MILSEQNKKKMDESLQTIVVVILLGWTKNQRKRVAHYTWPGTYGTRERESKKKVSRKHNKHSHATSRSRYTLSKTMPKPSEGGERETLSCCSSEAGKKHRRKDILTLKKVFPKRIDINGNSQLQQAEQKKRQHNNVKSKIIYIFFGACTHRTSGFLLLNTYTCTHTPHTYIKYKIGWWFFATSIAMCADDNDDEEQEHKISW